MDGIVSASVAIFVITILGSALGSLGSWFIQQRIQIAQRNHEKHKDKIEYLKYTIQQITDAYSDTFIQQQTDLKQKGRGKCLSIIRSVNDDTMQEYADNLFASMVSGDEGRISPKYREMPAMEDDLINKSIKRLGEMLKKEHQQNN